MTEDEAKRAVRALQFFVKGLSYIDFLPNYDLSVERSGPCYVVELALEQLDVSEGCMQFSKVYQVIKYMSAYHQTLKRKIRAVTHVAIIGTVGSVVTYLMFPLLGLLQFGVSFVVTVCCFVTAMIFARRFNRALIQLNELELGRVLF